MKKKRDLITIDEFVGMKPRQKRDGIFKLNFIPSMSIYVLFCESFTSEIFLRFFGTTSA